MSKADVIDALMDSATQMFARDGFGGTSLRDVAADAGVPLSSIHTYFGSKRSLYDEVCRKAWSTVTEERRSLLLKAAAAASDGIPTIRDIVYALAYPVVKRTFGAGGNDCDTIRIIREAATHQNSFGEADRSRRADEHQMYFLQCIARNYPKLAWPEVIWIYSFMIGIIYSWQVTDRHFDILTSPDQQAALPKLGNAAERISRAIVEFCSAGADACYEKSRIECDVAALTATAA